MLSKGDIASKRVKVEFSLEDMDMSEFQNACRSFLILFDAERPSCRLIAGLPMYDASDVVVAGETAEKASNGRKNWEAL